MGTSRCSHRWQRQTPPATSLDDWISSPNLKDPIHDSAMSVNATTSIDSPCRRLVSSSTSRSRLSRFHTQAHHRQPLLVARYPFIHSEEFNQNSTYASHPCPPFKLIRHVARWERYGAEEKVGRRTGTAVCGQCCSWPIPPNLFSF